MPAIRPFLRIALGLCVPAMPLAAQRPGGVVPGVEALLTDSLRLVQGKRVGLLTNHSGRDRSGTSTIDLLFRAPGVRLTALYGPEHGIRGVAKAGEKIGASVDSATGVKVYSLYGDVQVQTPEMLKDIDVLVYDIQDVGARVYTYQWTLALAAYAAKKPIIVLDRPDPIRADRYEGNLLDPKFASLVGQYPVALRYGLTPGELLRFLAGTKLIDADVKVVPMKGYRRSMWFDETGIPRVNPSPNLRTLDAELLYPGTVFFEGTTATEGRGTDAPFTLIGASCGRGRGGGGGRRGRAAARPPVGAGGGRRRGGGGRGGRRGGRADGGGVGGSEGRRGGGSEGRTVGGSDGRTVGRSDGRTVG